MAIREEPLTFFLLRSQKWWKKQIEIFLSRLITVTMYNYHQAW